MRIHHTKIKYLALVLIPCFAALCASCGTRTVPEAEEDLQAYLDQIVGNDPSLLNAVLLAEAAGVGLRWAGASGVADPENGTAMTEYHTLLTASVTKMFTSITIAMLYEKGLLDFESFINSYLPDDIMSGLHIFEGSDYSGEITIKSLLSHTSGLPDYFTLQPESGPSFIDIMLGDPSRFWTPEEMIQFAKESLEPLCAPGQCFHYADTNYQLLGLIIEQVTGKKLHEVFQEFILDPLDMKHTYLILRSEPADPSTQPMSHVIFMSTDVTNFTSLSAAWADGGIVATVEDLRIFMRALSANRLVHAETLKTMQDWIPFEDVKGMYYGFGFMLFRFPQLNPLLFRYPDIWGHAGSTGSFLYYCPELDAVITGTMNQSTYEQGHIQVVLNVLDIIGSISE